MENLMREIAGEKAGDAAGSTDSMSEEDRARAFKAAWESMLVEGMDGNIEGAGGLEGLGGVAKDGSAEKGKDQGGAGFQDKIKQAMDKLKESESKFQVGWIIKQAC